MFDYQVRVHIHSHAHAHKKKLFIIVFMGLERSQLLIAIVVYRSTRLRIACMLVSSWNCTLIDISINALIREQKSRTKATTKKELEDVHLYRTVKCIALQCKCSVSQFDAYSIHFFEHSWHAAVDFYYSSSSTRWCCCSYSSVSQCLNYRQENIYSNKM